MNLKLTVAAILISLFSVQFSYAQNESADRSFRVLVDFAGEFGGDVIAVITFNNGDDQELKAGNGLSLGVGGEYTVPNLEKLKFRGWIGYKYSTSAASNINISKTLVPINLTANWMITKDIRVGAGLAMQTGIKFKVDDEKVDFGNASGPMFELAWRFIGIRYTMIDWSVDSGESINANAFGISLNFAFPR